MRKSATRGSFLSGARLQLFFWSVVRGIWSTRTSKYSNYSSEGHRKSTILGMPENIDAKATFFENGADSSCDMIFNYKNAKAILKSTLLEETETEAIFTCTNGTLKIHKRSHEPNKVTVVQNNLQSLSFIFILAIN